MTKRFLLLLLSVMTVLQLSAASSGRTDYCDWSVSDDYVLTITTHGKKLPDFSVGNPSPWTQYHRNYAQYGNWIKSIITDAPNISAHCFAELEEVTRVEAENATFVGSSAFRDCGRPGFTLVLPKVEAMDHYAFLRCNAGVIALPKIKIVKQGFYDCPYLKQVDLGEDLTEIERNSFMYCPMMWLDDEPNIFLSCKKAPSINRGWWEPENKEIMNYKQFFYSKLGGLKTPDSLDYVKAFHYSTCFDDLKLYEKKLLFPYIYPEKMNDKSSVFAPKPDGYDFNGKPKIVIPADAFDVDLIGWSSLIGKWSSDVDFFMGGRVMVKNDEYHSPYIGYWMKNSWGANPTELFINTYLWELIDNVPEDTSSEPVTVEERKANVPENTSSEPVTFEERKAQLVEYMPWYETIKRAIITGLHVKTPKITSHMFFDMECTGEVTLDEVVTEIGRYAFYSATMSNSLDLQNITKIGSFAFYYNPSQTEAILPNIEEIGQSAFFHAEKLKKVVLGDNKAFTKIPISTFEGCEQLEEVHIGKNVTEIGTEAFGYTKLDNNNSEKGLFMAGPAPSAKKDVFVNGYDDDGYNIYMKFEDIYLHIPEAEYKSYDEDGSVWQKMNRETELVFPIAGDGWKLAKDGTLTISKNVANFTSITQQPWAKYRRYIKYIDIQEGVTEIGNNAFRFTADESHLYQVYTPSTLKRIGNYAFAGNDELKYFGKGQPWELYLPNELEEIGDYAFADCSMMLSVDLGEYTTKIGKYFVQGCPILSVGVYSATPATIDRYTFEGTVENYDRSKTKSPDKIKCEVINEDYEVYLTYLTTTWWKDLQYERGNLEVWYSQKMYGGKFILTSDSVMHIMAYSKSGHVLDGTFDGDGHDAYGNPQSMGGGLLHETSIIGWEKEEAHSSKVDFSSKNKVADKIKKVEVHEGVTFLGGACCFLPNLQRVKMAESVKQLWNTFFECPKLDSVRLPNVKSLGGTTFSSAFGRTTDPGMMDAAHDHKFYKGVFAHCSGMRWISMPEVTYVGDSAFCGCSKLNDGYEGWKVDTICAYAYARCNSIYGFDASKVKHVTGGHNFAGCTYLGWIVLGNNAPIYGMFEGCKDLYWVSLGEQISLIGNKAFLGCPIEEIYCATPNPPTFDLNAKETVRDHIFGGIPLGEIKVYTYGDYIDHYRAAEGWKEMAVTVPAGYETVAAIPAAGWISDQNWTNKAKWELITSGTLNIYGEGPTPDAEMDPRLKHFSEYIKEVRVQDGVTQITKPLWQVPLFHDNYPNCHKVYIPATMEKMCIGTFCTDLIVKNYITDVYCYAENPVDISYERIDWKEKYGSSTGLLTHSTAWGVLGEYYDGVDDIEQKNAELREETVIPRLHVLMKKGVKEAYEAAPGYKYAFDEIIADLSETDEVALPKQYVVTFLGYEDKWIATEIVDEGDYVMSPPDPKREGYQFMGWDHELENVTENFVARATWKQLDTYFTITVMANNDEMGIVFGGGSFIKDSEITIKAKAYDGFKFVQWNDGVTDAERTVKVTEDKIYIATFVDKTQAVEEVSNEQVQSMKVLRNGQIYIFRGGKIYTVQGQEIK